jgi:hypothetical protein
MLKTMLAAGVAVGLSLVPAQAQDAQVNYESALRCGAVIGFFSGVVEEEDMDLANQMSAISTVWFTMAAMRSESEEQMDADVDRLLDWIDGEVADKVEDEDALDAFMGGEFDTCSALRDAAQEEFAETEAMIAAEDAAEDGAEEVE